MKVKVRVSRSDWTWEQEVEEADVQGFLSQLKFGHPSLFYPGVVGAVTKNGKEEPLDLTPYIQEMPKDGK